MDLLDYKEGFIRPRGREVRAGRWTAGKAYYMHYSGNVELLMKVLSKGSVV